MTTLKSTLLFFVCFNLCACSSLTTLMFHPRQDIPVTPNDLGLIYEKVQHRTQDGIQLQSWWLPAQNAGEQVAAKGSIVVLHGNAQNISYHQMSVNWLVQSGYNLFLLDYREFGLSDGLAKLPDVFLDVHSALDWVVERQSSDQPVFVLGQSIGATLAVYGLASYDRLDEVDGWILDAAFDSYPDMAMEAMGRFWLTWPLMLPAWSISSDYDPIAWIEHLADIPLLMMHSPDDRVVPYERGRRLYDQAKGNKVWIDSHGPHVASFRDNDMRQAVLNFMQKHP